MALPVPTNTLQRIDRWAGVPVCAILSVIRKLFARDGGGSGRPRNILFVKFAEQGSTVLAYPAIRRAVELVGRENVHFIVFEENRFILDALNVIPRENVITIRHANFLSLIGGALRAVHRMRKLKFDAAVDLEFFSRSSAALTFLSGARSRAGFHTFFGEGPYRGDLMTHRLLYNPYLHTSQIFQLMIEALTVSPRVLPTFGLQPPPVEGELPQFIAEANEREAVRVIIQRESRTTADAPLVLLNPNASDLLPLRRWEPERYVELARRLLGHFPEIRIGMTGAPTEVAPIEQLVEAVGSRRCFSFAGKTTLRQLLILYSFAELLITNDSGPAHFASMTPINVITLFGPETPSLFAARTARNTPIWMGIACSPCVNAFNNRQSPCTNNVCMQQITVEMVLDHAVNVLRERGVTHPLSGPA
jgi:ADP-heptose:LPS heptosyltransferase